MSPAMEENQHQAHHSEHYEEVHEMSFLEDSMVVGCLNVVVVLGFGQVRTILGLASQRRSRVHVVLGQRYAIKRRRRPQPIKMPRRH